LRDLVVGAPKLERADPLQVLRFQKYRCAGAFIEAARGYGGGPVGNAVQSFGGGNYICVLDHLLSSREHLYYPDIAYGRSIPMERTVLLDGNTFKHYPEHAGVIREWLASRE
jgi:hypothetical protein